jgi:hypothetical protein
MDLGYSIVIFCSKFLIDSHPSAAATELFRVDRQTFKLADPISIPKPDFYCALPIYEDTSLEKRLHLYLYRQNFQLANILKLQDRGLIACPLRNVKLENNRSHHLKCFPWLIAEFKHVKPGKANIEYAYCQAANGSRVSLDMLDILSNPPWQPNRQNDQKCDSIRGDEGGLDSTSNTGTEGDETESSRTNSSTDGDDGNIGFHENSFRSPDQVSRQQKSFCDDEEISSEEHDASDDEGMHSEFEMSSRGTGSTCSEQDDGESEQESIETEQEDSATQDEAAQSQTDNDEVAAEEDSNKRNCNDDQAQKNEAQVMPIAVFTMIGPKVKFWLAYICKMMARKPRLVILLPNRRN